MSRIALVLSLIFGAAWLALASADPLSSVRLTNAERAAGFRTIELQVNGTNCRFCRINVERTLKDVAGVQSARADMAHHRARVIYDPRLVRPEELVDAVHGIGVGAVVEGGG